MKNIFAIALICFVHFAKAQNINPVEFQFKIVTQGDEQILIADAKIKEGWNIYSHNNSEDGPIPTSIELDNANPKGKIIEKGDVITKYDELFMLEVSKYKKKVEFAQAFTDLKEPMLKGFVTYMCCDDKRCLPPVDVSFELSVE